MIFSQMIFRRKKCNNNRGMLFVIFCWELFAMEVDGYQ